MKLPAELTRKVGPLPVWGWAALAVAAGFLLLRSRSSSATPVLPAASSGAQQPASGQGNPADNSSGDLLDALGANQDAANALLAAVQAAGGGYGSTAGSGTATASTSAPTVIADAPASPSGNYNDTSGLVTGSQIIAADPSYAGQLDPNTLYRNQGGDLSNVQDTSDALSRYLGNVNTATATAYTAPASAPTVVQPAPVDTTSATVAPGGRATIAKPVAA